MKRLLKIAKHPVVILLCITAIFFWKVFIKGYIPFPGDLLLTQYAPWRHASYGGYVAGAIPSKDQYFDVIRELYPWKTLVVEQLKHGNFPLWNPYNFSGSSLLANYQSQVFYPLAVMYFLLPQVTAWTVMVISQPILGSIFMYVFATEIGLSSSAAILTALLFNFSSFANIWVEFTTVWHTILWLPLLLYIIERAVKQKRLFLWQQLLFIFALFSSITGGHPQDFINTLLIFLAYTVTRLLSVKEWPLKEKLVFMVNPLSIIIVIPFFLAAPQLLPTIELFQNSARVTHDYAFVINNLIVQFWQLPLIVVADFFGNPATKSSIFGDYILKTLSIGVTGFSFVIISFFSSAKSWHKTFFLCTAVIILLLTVRSPLSELFYRYPIPILSTGTPTRILFVLMLSLSVLAGIGFNETLKPKHIPFKAIALVWFILGSLWVLVILHPTFSNTVFTQAAILTMKRSMILATTILGLISLIVGASSYKKEVLYIAILVCIGELFYSFTKFNPFVPKLFVYPQNNLITFLKSRIGIDRFWGYGTGQIEANFATQEHLFSPDGTDPLNLAWYNKFIQSSQNGHIATTFTRSTRSDAKLQPGYGDSDLPSNEFRLRLMDILGVKYVLDRTENPRGNGTFPQNRFKEIWRQDDWIVYENLKAAPRFFTTSDVKGYTSDKDFENQLFSGTFHPEKSVLVENRDFLSLPRFTESSAQTTLLSYTPRTIEFLVNTDSPKFFYISDTYDTGWTSEINNQPTHIYKANYAFRGVVVPAGQSRLSFTYRPQSFSNGIKASVVGIAISIIYIIYVRQKVIGKGRLKH